MRSKAVLGGGSRRGASGWVVSILSFFLVLPIVGCARHPLPELDFDDQNGAPDDEDPGDGDGDTPDKPKPNGMNPDPDPPARDAGDGDGDDPIVTPEDASTQQPTPDASTEPPGDLTPHADNSGTCPKEKPRASSSCISFDGQCRYGTAPVIECQCIAVAWLCR